MQVQLIMNYRWSCLLSITQLDLFPVISNTDNKLKIEFSREAFLKSDCRHFDHEIRQKHRENYSVHGRWCSHDSRLQSELRICASIFTLVNDLDATRYRLKVAEKFLELI